MDRCREVLEAMGYAAGRNGKFAGRYRIKGCYAYNAGKYKGIGFYGPANPRNPK